VGAFRTLPPAIAAVLEEHGRVVVVGLGISGIDAALFLRRLGCAVTCVERSSETQWRERSKFRERLAELRAAGIELCFDADGERSAPALEGAGLVVLSPGVSLESAIAGAIQRRGLPVVSEFELGIELSRTPALVVTGSNGKSTTVSLLQALFEADGRVSRLCGNIGTPVVSTLTPAQVRGEEPPPYEALVVEASSYQLETCMVMKPRTGVFLNISDNHLERHGTIERYFAAKARLFAHQTGDDTAILNFDDPRIRALAGRIRSRVLALGRDEAALRGFDSAHITFDPIRGLDAITVRLASGVERYELAGTRLLGLHNRYNIAAAILAARVSGISPAAISRGIIGFAPLEHRLEFVSEIATPCVINDSKSTTVAATVAALHSVHEILPGRRVTLMIGGLAKAGSWDPLMKALHSRRADMAPVVCFGQDANLLASHCRSAGVPGVTAPSLRAGVEVALSGMSPDGVLLLSPGCASFDEFGDFEERGRVFKELARAVTAPRSAEG